LIVKGINLITKFKTSGYKIDILGGAKEKENSTWTMLKLSGAKKLCLLLVSILAYLEINQDARKQAT
jgi:hypothetical protein